MRRVLLLGLFFALVVSLHACASAPSPRVAFEDADAEFSRVRYFKGDLERDLISLNDRCPVTGTRLNPAIDPVFVNGRPIGFC